MEQDALIPYSTTPSSYNFGPRPKTDVKCGIAFVVVLAGFLAWTAAEIGIASGNSNSTPVWSPPSQCDTTNFTLAERANHTADLSAAIATPLFLSVVGGFIFGILTLFGFQKVPQFMVWFVVVTKILAIGGLGVFLMVMSESDDGTSQAFQYSAYACFGVAGLTALLYFCIRDQIRLCAMLFKVSAKSLDDNWTLLPFKAALGLLTTVCKVVILVLPLWMLFGKGYFQEVQQSDGSMECNYLFPLESTGLYVYIAYFVFAFGWFAFWALETRTYIVADVTSHWYWHGKANGALKRAAKHGLLTHFGSMAFAGLVLWFVEQMKAIVRKATNGKGIMAIICCLLKCLIMMCLNYLEFLCKMSVVMIGINGKSFTSAGNEVVSLFTNSFGDMALSTTVWVFPERIIGWFTFLISLAVGGLSGLFTYLAIKDIEGSDASPTNYGLAVGGASWFIVLYILVFFGHVLLNVVDTVFLCFMVDKSKGIVTKPEIHEVLNSLVHRHYTKKGKSVPQSFGNQSVTVVSTTTTTIQQQPGGGGGGGYYPNIQQQQQQQQQQAPPSYTKQNPSYI